MVFILTPLNALAVKPVKSVAGRKRFRFRPKFRRVYEYGGGSWAKQDGI